MTEPLVVLSELQDLTKRLDEASKQIYQLEEQFSNVAEDWEDAWDREMAALVSEYEARDKRLPGEDVRATLIRQRIREGEPALYDGYRGLRRKLERMHKRARRIEQGISGKQSILSYLKTEAQAT